MRSFYPTSQGFLLALSFFTPHYVNSLQLILEEAECSISRESSSHVGFMVMVVTPGLLDRIRRVTD